MEQHNKTIPFFGQQLVINPRLTKALVAILKEISHQVIKQTSDKNVCKNWWGGRAYVSQDSVNGGISIHYTWFSKKDKPDDNWKRFGVIIENHG